MPVFENAFNLRCKDFKDCIGCPFDNKEYAWLCEEYTNNNITLGAAVVAAETDLQVKLQSLYKMTTGDTDGDCPVNMKGE